MKLDLRLSAPINSSLQKEKIIDVEDQTIASKSDRQSFARMFLIQQGRNLDIRRVVKSELGADPHSVVNLDGCLRKSVESKLIVFLENDIHTEPSLSSNTILATFLKLSPELKIFEENSDYILQGIFNEGGGRLVFLVTNPYLQN